MDREIEEGILGVKEEIHKRTGISSTRLRQKDEDKSRYIGLHYERCFINGV